MPCCKCDANKVIHYCLECEESFCHECSQRIHQEKDAEHTIEAIADTESQGAHIITPLADEFILIVVLWFAASRIAFPRDYFAASKYCPFLEEVRAGVARVDAGAVHVIQGTLQEACGLEDLFWRFYIDAWLRSIVTGTDSIVVLFASAFHVFFSDIAVVYIMIPVVSCVYALFFWLLHWFESHLPRTDYFKLLEMASQSINVVDLIEDTPPVTLPRTDAAANPLDWFTYTIRRVSRVPRYFYVRISSKLEAFLYWSIVISLSVRVTCIFFGVGALVPVCLVASLLALLHAKSYESWPLKNPKQMLLLVLMLLVSGVVAVSTFRKHVVLFANVGKRTQLSEQIFWHVVQGVFYISRDGVATLLKALAVVVVVVVLALLGLPLVWKLFGKHFKQQ